MTRDQLEHAIRAACDVSKDTELWIFGSQAILAEFPDAPKSLRASIEVDVQPKNRPERTDANILTERINALDINEQLLKRILYWLSITAEELYVSG